RQLPADRLTVARSEPTRSHREAEVMNLASILKRTGGADAHQVPRAAPRGAARVAVRLGDDTTSFAELDRASGQIVGLLQERGVQPGDRVAIMLPNVPAFAVVYYGVLRAGGVVVPMNPLLKAREIAYYLGDSGARLIFGWYEVAEEVR